MTKRVKAIAGTAVVVWRLGRGEQGCDLIQKRVSEHFNQGHQLHRRAVATSSNATIYLGSRRGRREAAYEPAEQEEYCAGEKNGKTRRVVPGIVDILTDVEQGPKEERACAEILNDLGGLGGD